MKLFEGKTKSERNKMIAAIILGAACLIVLFFAFGRNMFSSGPTTAKSTKPSPTPAKGSTSRTSGDRPQMPAVEDQMREWMSLPVVYNPNQFGAPDAGRNIFAFYEPPLPTPWQPTPEPPRPTPTPMPPPPPPPIEVRQLTPGSVYAGSNGFRLELNGDRFTPDTKIYFEQQELPSTFVSEQKMTADIPSVLIRGEGRKQILAQTADGTKISNPIALDVQAPPKPQFQYIGMIARKRSNNDTAYFKEAGKDLPTSARLNDVVGARFRVLSISADEVVLEDTSLGFKHKLPLFNPPATATTGPAQPGQPGRGGPQQRDSFMPSPGQPIQVPNQRIPGIPDNIPRYIPPGSNMNTNPAPRQPANTKQEVDDDGDGR
jgi:hypothetical protein